MFLENLLKTRSRRSQVPVHVAFDPQPTFRGTSATAASRAIIAVYRRVPGVPFRLNRHLGQLALHPFCRE